MSDVELFTEFYNIAFPNSKLNPQELGNYVDLFFINIREYPKLKYQLDLDKRIPRDTHIYTLYNKQNKNERIFTYTIIYLIKKYINNSKFGSTDFYSDIEISQEITNILLELFNKIDIILSQYGTLVTQKSTLSNLYNRLVLKKRKVFAFIKIRQDTKASYNPRFNKKIIDNQDNYKSFDGKKTFKNEYLALRYYNVDGKYGFDTQGIYSTSKCKADLAKSVQDFGKPDSDNNMIDYQSKLGDKKNRKEYYFFGPFDGIFESNLNNNQIATQSSILMLDKLINQNQDMCIIGYGQSGSGKTSTLIYFKKEKQDGIIIELCKLPQFYNTFDHIELKMVNLYVYHGSGVNDMSGISENNYKYTLMEVHNDKVPTFKYDIKLNTWVYEKDLNNIDDTKKKGLGVFIETAFAEREIEPTPNNPNSSRSHVIVCLTLRRANGQGSRKLVVCDLAGVENVFNCENPEEILKFDDRYKLSDDYNATDGTKTIKFDRYFCDQEGGPIIKDKTLIDEYNHNMDISANNKSLSNNSSSPSTISSPAPVSRTPSPAPVSRTPSPAPVSRTSSPAPVSRTMGATSSRAPAVKPRSTFGGGQGCKPAVDLEGCAKELKFIGEHGGDLNVIENKIAELTGGKENKVKTILMGIKNDPNNYYRTLMDTWSDIDSDEAKSWRKAIVEVNKSLLGIPYSIGSTGKPNIPKKFSLLDQKYFGPYKNKNMALLDKLLADITKADSSKGTLIKEWICEYERVRKLVYNCKLRRNEGYMINASLKGMRDDIQTLIKKSLSLNKENKDFLPLFYEKEVYPYCRNININDEYFEQFYGFDSTSNLSGILLKIMSDKTDPRGFGLDMSSINFVIFTVINLTDDGKVNNGPNPPFININELIYNRNIEYNQAKLKTNIINTLAETKQYQFYINNTTMKELYTREQYLSGYDDNDTKNYAKDLIKLIDANNPSTLIGSLASTDILLNTVYNKLVCSTNDKLDNILTKYKNKKLDSYITSKYDIKQIESDFDKPEFIL